MGGQACVFYGAAEFSRDADFAILADAANLARLGKALAELCAEVINILGTDADPLAHKGDWEKRLAKVSKQLQFRH